MDNQKGKLTFSHITVKGKDKTINTDKVYGFVENDIAFVILIDPSTGSQWGENLASLMAGSINDSIKEFVNKESVEEITQLEEQVKNIIKQKIQETAKTLPKNSVTTMGEISLHLTALLWFNDKISVFSAGKTSVYKVENHQLKAIYLIMDKPPIKLSPSGDLLKFSISIQSFEDNENLSSIIMTSDGFYSFLKNPKIHNLMARVDSPRSVLSKLEEYLKNHTPDDNATIIMVWKESETEEAAAEDLPTLSTTTSIAGALNNTTTSSQTYNQPYNKDTVERLRETLRNIQETEIGKELAKKQNQKRKKKTSRLLAQPHDNKEISPLMAIIIVLIFLLLFGGFLYIRYGDTIKGLFATTPQQTEHNKNSGETTKTVSTSTTSQENTVSSPTTTATETTNTEEETTTTTENQQTTSTETNTSSPTPPAEYKKIYVVTKPSGLRVTLIETDNNGRQKTVINSCKSPCEIDTPINLSNPMFVAMYSGAICASYPHPQASGWTTNDLKNKVILDCEYIVKGDPQHPILITTNPSNIRIKIFDNSGKELFSALSPSRVGVLGKANEKVTIRAFIKNKQCAAYQDTWQNILDKKHIHLLCKP